MTKEFNAEEWEQIRAEELRLLFELSQMPGDCRLITEAAIRQQVRRAAKLAQVPEVGLFFMMPDGKVFLDGVPYTEVPSYAGFRTYSVDHDQFWSQLRRIGSVPRDLEYDEVARGRVTYEDSSRTFTLFADRCAIKNKRAINSVMSGFNLPHGTKVLPDSHYKCPRCAPRSKKKEGWI